MSLFKDVLQHNKQAIQLISRQYLKQMKQKKQQQLDKIDKEIHEAHDFQEYSPYGNSGTQSEVTDLQNIFMSVQQDDDADSELALSFFDENHAVNQQNYRAFQKANGVTYATYNKAYQSVRQKIKQLKRLPPNAEKFKISGVWTPSEHQTFLQIARRYSFDARIIATFLPHKTEQLVRRHIAWCRRRDFHGLMRAGGRDEPDHAQLQQVLDNAAALNGGDVKQRVGQDVTLDHLLVDETQPNADDQAELLRVLDTFL